jgi:hypothetical protein
MASPFAGSPFGADENAPADEDSLRQELSAALEPGEKVLWKGFPRQGVMLRAQDIFLIPFSLMWCGFAVFWEFSTITWARAPIFFQLWGVPFVLVGLYLVFGRFFVDAWTRARTGYAVTDKRVLVLSGLWRRNTRSLELLGLSEINIAETKDGRGTITFGPTAGYAQSLRGWPGAAQSAVPAFEGIVRPRDVLKTVRNAQRALVGAHP